MLRGLIDYYFLINRVFEDLKKWKTFWFFSALVEARAGQDIASWISSKLENAIPLFIDARKFTGPLFTLGLLHIFTQLKVDQVCLTE